MTRVVSTGIHGCIWTWVRFCTGNRAFTYILSWVLAKWYLQFWSYECRPSFTISNGRINQFKRTLCKSCNVSRLVLCSLSHILYCELLLAYIRPITRYRPCLNFLQFRWSIFTLLHCALASCGAVYCNRSCLFVCGCVCGWVCYNDNSKLRASIFTKLGL